MATLAEFRTQNPAYGDRSDSDLADALYRKHYSDMDRGAFNQKIGYTPQNAATGTFDAAMAGASFEFGDELSGIEAGLLGKVPDPSNPTGYRWFDYSQSFGDRRRAATDAERGRLEAFQTDRPVLATAGRIGGAVTAGVAGGGIGGLGRTAAGAAARGAAEGSAAGFLYGMGQGEGGAGERAAGAVDDAAIGLAGGALAGLATQQLAKAWRGFRAARQGASVPQADREAMDLLTKNLRTLGYSDEDITARINQAVSSGNSERALFEAFDEAHQPDLARTIKSGAQLSPGASSQARNFAETRRAGQQDRLVQGFREAMGNEDFSTVRSNLQQRYQTQAAPIFNQLRPQPVQVTPRLREIVRSIDAEGVRPARANAQGRGVVTPMSLADDSGATAGPIQFGSLHDLAQDLGDEASAAFRAGRGNQGSRIRTQERALRDYMKEVSPEFREASGVWRSAKMDEEALDAGRSVFTTDPEDLADMALDFSQSEREHFVAGVARAFREKIRGAADSHDATRRLASNNLRDRLRAALGDEGDRIIAALDEEALLAANENALNPAVGSQTSPLTQGAQAFVPPGRRAAATAMETDLTLSNLRRAGAEAMRTPDPRFAESYVDLMLTPQGQGLLPRNRRVGLLQTPDPLSPVQAGRIGATGGLLGVSSR